MKKMILVLAALLTAAAGGYAGNLEDLKDFSQGDLLKSFSAIEKDGRNGGFSAIPQPGTPQPALTPAPQRGLSCNRPAVYIKENGGIYSGETFLGHGAKDFKTGCTGNVAWMDRSGYLYRNADRIGLEVKEYEITNFTGDVVWTDGYKFIYRNRNRIGSAVKKYTITAVTGDVIFTDSWNYLYKNSGAKTARIGAEVKEYKVSSFTGNAAWLDSRNYLYKTEGEYVVRLGSDAKEFAIASITGDVAWRDASGFLYKNGSRLTTDAREYRMNARGVVIWKDSAGVLHSA